jgi:hypothetical protein
MLSTYYSSFVLVTTALLLSIGLVSSLPFPVNESHGKPKSLDASGATGTGTSERGGGHGSPPRHSHQDTTIRPHGRFTHSQSLPRPVSTSVRPPTHPMTTSTQGQLVSPSASQGRSYQRSQSIPPAGKRKSTAAFPRLMTVIPHIVESSGPTEADKHKEYRMDRATKKLKGYEEQIRHDVFKAKKAKQVEASASKDTTTTPSDKRVFHHPTDLYFKPEDFAKEDFDRVHEASPPHYQSISEQHDHFGKLLDNPDPKHLSRHLQQLPSNGQGHSRALHRPSHSQDSSSSSKGKGTDKGPM